MTNLLLALCLTCVAALFASMLLRGGTLHPPEGWPWVTLWFFGWAAFAWTQWGWQAAAVVVLSAVTIKLK